MAIYLTNEVKIEVIESDPRGRDYIFLFVFFPDCCDVDVMTRSSTAIFSHEVTLGMVVKHNGEGCRKYLESLIQYNTLDNFRTYT